MDAMLRDGVMLSRSAPKSADVRQVVRDVLNADVVGIWVKREEPATRVSCHPLRFYVFGPCGFHHDLPQAHGTGNGWPFHFGQELARDRNAAVVLVFRGDYDLLVHLV